MTIIKFLPLGNQKCHRNCINSHDWQLHLTVARQLKCLFICSWSVALSSCGRDLVNKTSPSLFCGATELSALAWISVAGGDITLTLCPAWAHSRCLSHQNCHEISVLFSWWSFPPQDRRCLLLSLVRQRWWAYQGSYLWRRATCRDPCQDLWIVSLVWPDLGAPQHWRETHIGGQIWSWTPQEEDLSRLE